MDLNLPPAAGRLPIALVSALEGKGIRALQRDLASLRPATTARDPPGAAALADDAPSVHAAVVPAAAQRARTARAVSAEAAGRAATGGGGGFSGKARPEARQGARRGVSGREVARRSWFERIKK